MSVKSSEKRCRQALSLAKNLFEILEIKSIFAVALEIRVFSLVFKQFRTPQKFR